MTLSKNILIIFGLLVLAGVVFIALQSNLAIGESFTGTATNVVSATSTAVGPDTVVTLFAINGSCDTRIITTNNDAIHLSFRTITGFAPTSVVGHYQAASTTVAYDSGLYGCGLVTALGLTASGTVTISETQ